MGLSFVRLGVYEWMGVPGSKVVGKLAAEPRSCRLGRRRTGRVVRYSCIEDGEGCCCFFSF
jgi:hypothetical protein